MAKAKTGYFTLTEQVTLDLNSVDGSRFTGSFDLGSYVDVGDKQGISISSVSYIWQNGANNDSNPSGMLAANGSFGVQVTDQNPNSVFLRANDPSLVASGHMNIDIVNNITSNDSDIFPDNWGTDPEQKNIISDTLFLVCGNDGAAVGSASVHCTIMIRMRIVTLTAKDYYAIAIKASASN